MSTLELDIKNNPPDGDYVLKLVDRTTGEATNFPVTLNAGVASVDVADNYAAGSVVRGFLVPPSLARGMLVSGVIK